MQVVAWVREIADKLSLVSGVEVTVMSVNPRLPESDFKRLAEVHNLELPESIRRFYCEEASSLRFSWIAEKECFGTSCKYGELWILSVVDIARERAEMMGIVADTEVEIRQNPDPGGAALVADWPGWTPFARFANGDALCFSNSPGSGNSDPEIVFLEHDVMDGGPNIHGMKIANSFTELIERWQQICFVEVFDWSTVVDRDGIIVEHELFAPLRQARSLTR